MLANFNNSFTAAFSDELRKKRIQNCPLTRATDDRIMRHGIISSCQLAATSQIVKRCWSQVCLV